MPPGYAASQTATVRTISIYCGLLNFFPGAPLRKLHSKAGEILARAIGTNDFEEREKPFICEVIFKQARSRSPRMEASNLARHGMF